MRWIPLLAGLVTGCAHSTLTPAQAARLDQPADAWGTHIYTGTVTPDGESRPVFRYERRVRDRGDGTRVSTHVTWQGDQPVVVQEATQDATGRLLAYDEVHRQRGEAYHSGAGDHVVGPTLFEFVRAHLPELRAGRPVPLEFWDRGSTYGFVLELAGATVEMRATSFLVSLGVAPMRLRLGPGDEIVSYHGRIPPLLGGRSVEAEVAYEYLAPFR